jgi:hypothetical protein
MTLHAAIVQLHVLLPLVWLGNYDIIPLPSAGSAMMQEFVMPFAARTFQKIYVEICHNELSLNDLYRIQCTLQTLDRSIPTVVWLNLPGHRIESIVVLVLGFRHTPDTPASCVEWLSIYIELWLWSITTNEYQTKKDVE